MLEELLEDIAQKNGLRETNMYIKLVAGIGAILLCLLSSGFIGPLFIAILFGFAILYLARIEAAIYAELFVIPLSFAVMSVAGIILLTGGSDPLWQCRLFESFSLSVTRQSLNQGILVFSRIIGGVSALCFISLTTPMTDIFIAMRQCRVPDVVIDLMMIIYRTIFILVDQVVQIYHAQVMRLGYTRYRESILSFATLCGAAFIASWDAGEDLVRAMDARCYDGKFAVAGGIRPAEPIPVLVALVFLAVSSLVVILSGTVTLL